MGMRTIGGNGPDAVGTTGVPVWASGQPLSAEALTAEGLDLARAAAQGRPAGAVGEVICTASGLTVSVPAGSVIVAGVVWEVVDEDVPVVVPDDATSYVWACSDGHFRTTSTLEPPMGWGFALSALVCAATAAGGAIALDHSVQARASTVDAGSGELDLGPAAMAQRDVIYGFCAVPVGSQVRLADDVSVYGSLEVYGRVYIEEVA